MAEVTASAVRQYIKSNGIGCVGTVVRFRGRNKQVHATHIQDGWFCLEDIAALHESKLQTVLSCYFKWNKWFIFYKNMSILFQLLGIVGLCGN